MKTPETANLRRPRRLGLPAVLLLCLGCLRFPFWASAQADTSIYEPYSITTLAGLALNSGSTDNTGNLARFNRPYGVAVDGFGTVYVADTGNHSIRKITSGGAVTLLAGIPGTSGSANGANLGAMFSNPTGVAVDSTGDVYVADYNNHLIRQISGGTVSTLAGSVGVAGSTDGTGTAAQFRNPFGVAVNSAGTVVYVSDMNNQTIRMITVPGGVVTTLTGSPNVNGSTDGPNNVALFNTPRGIAVDSGGNIFVSDSGNLTVRKILSGGGVSTLAGAVFTPGFNDGPGLGARFSLLQAISPFGGPCGVAVDAIGNVYVADQGSTGAGYTIRKITPGLSVTTLAGSVGVAGSTDATGIAVGFNLPAGVAVDSAGKIYVADTVNHTIRVGVDTNCGNSVPVITCPTNKMVNCGTDWTFDAPIATSACGTNLTVSVLHTVTNTGPCSTVITRTWQATSCFGAGMKSWSPLGAGLNGEVWALTEMGGNLYVGGQFTTAGGASANYIAKWNGTSWSQLGSGITNGLNGGVYALAVMGGKLFAAGYFTTAGGVTATNIAQWDGTSWSPLGTGLVAYSAVEALAVIGTDLYVGGGFSTADGGPGNLIAKYNTLTSVWSPLGSGMNDRVNSLTVVGTDLYAGGQFTSAGGVSANFVAKWNGSNWSALGTGMDLSVGGSLGVLGGNLYAGGVFTSAGGNSANRVAKWDIANSIWSSVGTGINNGMNDGVEGFAVMGTDLYASGGFMTAGGVSANRVAQWNGSTWSPLGTGMNNGVWRLAAIGQNLYAGGIFTTAGGLSANYIAKWGADCIPISVTCSQTVTIVDTTPPVFTCTNPSVASFSAGTTSDNFVGPEPASPSAGLILRLQSNGVSSLKGFDDNCAINTFFAHTFTNLPLCITKATLSVRLKGCSSSQTYNDSFGLSFTFPSGALVPTSWSRYLGSHNSNPATGLFTNFDSGTTLDVVLDLSQLPNADGSTTDLIPTLNVQGFLDLVIQDDSAIDFAVLTVTSCCATETKTVECGTAWTFDAPTVSDSCSGTNVTLTVLSTVTNGVCPRIITRTWKATDACGNSVTNSQAVTVVDTTPPVLTCATNKTVQCGTAWIFDAPTASDACSTNVTISIFNTVTNGICPLLITRTWSAADACGNSNTCSQTVTVVDTICVACETWTPHETNRVWTAVASSADGSRLVATVHNGLVYTSGNAGLTWTPQNSGNLGWVCVASDSTGQHLVAAANPGQIYTSSNFGGTWTVQTSGNKTWRSVASDSTGQYLVAVADNDNIYTSSNSGGTWTARGIGIGLQNWHSVASSADGSKLVAVGYGIPIYTSTDFGLTWTAQTNSGSRDWQSVASSADGSKLVAGVYQGLIYTSGNAGLTWTHNLASSGLHSWDSIASSADGNKLVAVVYNGLIYCSTDSGVSWAGHESNRAWHGVAASSDASKLVAVVYGGGQIYTADCPPAFVLNCATNKTVQCGTAWTFDAPTVSDSCSGTNLTVSILSTVTNGVCPMIITRTWQATDACGNTNTCSQVVSVVDTTPPVLTCSNPTVMAFSAGTTNDDFAGLEPAFPSAGLLLRLQIAGITSLKGFDDNCAINTFFAHTFTNLPSCISGATLRVRLKGCVSNYTYDDTFGLSFTSPSGALAQPGWSRYLGSHNSNPATGLFTDFTGGTTLDVVLDLSQLPNADGSTTDLIPTLNAQGLLDLVIQDDSSIDFAVLTVTSCCGTNINTKTVNCGTDWIFDAPTVSDSCSGTNVTLTVLSTVTNGVCPRIITRTWQATDACGNTNTCSQSVTVVDTMPPTIACPGNITRYTCANAIRVYYAAWAVDACSPTVSLSYSPPSGSYFAAGTNTPVTVTATDGCGNTSTCTFQVKVINQNASQILVRGLPDCYNLWVADPAAVRSACLNSSYSPALWNSFDNSTINRRVGVSWQGLPSSITSAQVTTRMKPRKTLFNTPQNDTIAFGLGTCNPASWLWSQSIGTVLGQPWLFQPNCGVTFAFNLQALPPGGGTTSLLPHLNSSSHRLDMLVQNDTVVDYAWMRIRYCAPIIFNGSSVTLGNAIAIATPSGWLLAQDPEVVGATNASAAFALGDTLHARLSLDLAALTQSPQGRLNVSFSATDSEEVVEDFGFQLVSTPRADGPATTWQPVAPSGSSNSRVRLMNAGREVGASSGMKPIQVRGEIPAAEIIFNGGTNVIARFATSVSVGGGAGGPPLLVDAIQFSFDLSTAPDVASTVIVLNLSDLPEVGIRGLASGSARGFDAIQGNVLAQSSGDMIVLSPQDEDSNDPFGVSLSVAPAHEFRAVLGASFDVFAPTSPGSSLALFTRGLVGGQDRELPGLRFDYTKPGWTLAATRDGTPLPLRRAQVWNRGAIVADLMSPMSVQWASLPQLHWPSLVGTTDAEIVHRFPSSTAVDVVVDGMTYSGTEVRITTGTFGEPVEALTGLRVEAVRAELLAMSPLDVGAVSYRLEVPESGDDEVTVRWSGVGGVLESASSLDGAWSAVAGSEGGEVTLPVETATARFFRVRGQ